MAFEDTPEGLGKMSVLKLVFLSFITAGVYSAVWFLQRLNAINGLSSPVKINQGVFGFIIAGCIANIALAVFLIFSGTIVTPQVSGSLSLTSDVLSLLVELTLLIQAFKVRRVFIDHFKGHLKTDIPFSWAATFFFSIFYLQYKINRF